MCTTTLQEIQENKLGPISTAIENITRFRAKHLPLIQEKEDMVKELTKALNDFAKWQDDVKSKHEDVKFTNLKEQITDLDEIADYKIDKLQEKLTKYKEQIERLRKRFERENVQISLIGYARQGKSCILQAITDLGDDVIPTSSNTDCTGAVSVIYNRDKPDKFDMYIEYYSPKEFVSAINNKLKAFFGDEAPQLNRIEEIPFVDKNLFDMNDEQQEGFYTDYILKYNQYKSCLLGQDPIHFDTTDCVIEYVAKYQMIKSDIAIPDKYVRAGYQSKVIGAGSLRKVLFAKFVTVKTATIYTQFPYEDSGRIVAVDTIGLGNALTSESDLNAMLKVLKNDTDIALYTYKPDDDGKSTWPQELKDTLNLVFGELEDVCPDKWVAGIINYKRFESFPPPPEDSDLTKEQKYDQYIDVVDTIKDNVIRGRYGKKGSEMFFPIVKCEKVDAKDKEAVRSYLIPVLTEITKNLPEIDAAMAKDANECGEAVFDEINSLCDKVGKIKKQMAEANPQRGATFRKNYGSLPLRKSLGKYRDLLGKQKRETNETISLDLKPQIANLTDQVPKRKDILSLLESNSLGAGNPELETMRILLDNTYAHILSKLKQISTESLSKIQKEAQEKLVSMLFEDGRWELLKLANLKANASSLDRLETFAKQKLSHYTHVQQVLESILQFQLNIEGYISNECALACLGLRNLPTDLDFTEMEDDDIAREMHTYLYNQVEEIIDSLNKTFGIEKTGDKQADYVLSQPNMSIWRLVDTFYQEMYSAECKGELEDFYREYQDTFWKDENKNDEEIDKIISTYMTCLQSLCSHDKKEDYIINLKK